MSLTIAEFRRKCSHFSRQKEFKQKQNRHVAYYVVEKFVNRYLELGLAVRPFMVDATHVVKWTQLRVGIIPRQSL